MSDYEMFMLVLENGTFAMKTFLAEFIAGKYTREEAHNRAELLRFYRSENEFARDTMIHDLHELQRIALDGRMRAWDAAYAEIEQALNRAYL